MKGEFTVHINGDLFRIRLFLCGDRDRVEERKKQHKLPNTRALMKSIPLTYKAKLLVDVNMFIQCIGKP